MLCLSSYIQDIARGLFQLDFLGNAFPFGERDTDARLGPNTAESRGLKMEVN